jgi:type VII secretion effector (TIGR04197 family)
MARIRVNTEDLKNKAKDFDTAAEAFKRAGDDILAAAMTMPSYDGQLSGPARKAGYEIQKQARELSTALAGDAESLRKTAQAFEEVDNQAVDTFESLCANLASSQHQLRLAGVPEIHGDHNLGYEIDYSNLEQEGPFPNPASSVPLADQFAWFQQNRQPYSEPNGPYPLPGSLQEFLAKLAGYEVPLRDDITASEAAILNELMPWELLEGEDIYRDAFAVEMAYYGVNNNDGVPDAFRHAYWAARLTQAFGADWAKRFTDAHEGKIGNQAARDFMDRWNNALGIQIALDNPNASPEELANLIAQAINDGKGVYIPSGDVDNGPLSYTNQDPAGPLAPILPVEDTGSGNQ